MVFTTKIMTVVFLSLVLLLTGCGSQSPKSVVNEWRKALIAGDANKANSLSTNRVKMANAYIIAMIEAKKGEYASKDFLDSKIEEEVINGDKATVKFGENTIHLVKENGKWLVDIDKD